MTSSSLPPLVLGTEESRQLQDRIRRELVRREWSEGDDDEVMAEYILVMLANNKTSAQIAGELDDLVGETSEGGAGGAVASFVEWLWSERSRIGGEERSRSPAATSAEVTQVSHDPISNKSRRRSQSPERRRREGSETHSQQRRQYPSAEGSNRTTESDRWTEKNTRRNDTRREQYHRTARDDARQRELLGPSSRSSNGGRMASDDIARVNGNRRELFPTTTMRGSNGTISSAAMDGVEHGGNNPRSLRIQGSSGADGGGGEKIFQRSLERAQQEQNGGAQQGSSIFSRVSMPDPRAQEFVPRGEGGGLNEAHTNNTNLLSRLDPMVPVNDLPSNAPMADLTRHDTSYPTEPQDASLCRYSLKCTNPMCSFSHPSVSAVAASKGTGEEPLVLRQEACRFQHGCTNADCPFSHVSPAVAFVLAKSVSQQQTNFTASNAGSAAPCHFQMDCKNPACTYAHFDPATGLAQPPPASNNGNLNGVAVGGKLDQALGSSGGGEAKPCKFGARCTRSDCHFSHPASRPEAHVSDRLARFGSSEMDGEMETIIPAA